jgi:hypothetical protein
MALKVIEKRMMEVDKKVVETDKKTMEIKGEIE